MPDEVKSYKGTTRYTIDEIDDEQIRLTYRGGLTESTKTKASSSSRGPFGRVGPFGPSGGPPSPFSRPKFAGKTQTTNSITMTHRGTVLAMNGDSQLPFLLGNVSLMPFESLPESVSGAQQREWLSDSDVSITQEQEGRRPFGPFGPFGGNDSKSVKVGSEKANYSIESDADTKIVIKKTYQLSSPKVGDQPAFELTGTGTWTFDSGDGMPQSLDFNAKLSVDENNTKATIPISIKYHRLSVEEIAKLDADAQRVRVQRETDAAGAKLAAEAPLTPEEKAAAIATLRSNDSDQILKTLGQLGKKSPKEPDVEVAAVIKSLLGNPSKKIQEEAGKALARWSSAYKVKFDLNEAYDSHMPVKSTGRAVTDPSKLYVGQFVQAKLHASWFAAEILELRSDGKVLVRKRGFAPRDHTVSRSDIQLAPDELDQPNQPASLASKARGSRTWSDASESFKVDAVFVSSVDGKVTLRRTDGREVTVSLDRLSDEDQKYVNQLQAAAASPLNPFE